MSPSSLEVNRLVYELYGLTDKQIRIVEEATFTSPGSRLYS